MSLDFLRGLRRDLKSAGLDGPDPVSKVLQQFTTVHQQQLMMTELLERIVRSPMGRSSWLPPLLAGIAIGVVIGLLIARIRFA